MTTTYPIKLHASMAYITMFKITHTCHFLQRRRSDDSVLDSPRKSITTYHASTGKIEKMEDPISSREKNDDTEAQKVIRKMLMQQR